MNSKGNRIILLLVVSLATFSSAMKELHQVWQLGSEVNQFVARWSEKFTPAEVPAVVAEIKTCERKQSEPSVELAWLHKVAQQQDGTADVEKTDVAPTVAKRTRTTGVDALNTKKVQRITVDPVQFEVRILSDRHLKQEVPAVYEFPVPLSFKLKSRRPSPIMINPRDREILKTLNRSISVRIAS